MKKHKFVPKAIRKPADASAGDAVAVAERVDGANAPVAPAIASSWSRRL